MRYPRVRSRRQSCGHRTCIAILRGSVRIPHVLTTSPRGQVPRCGAIRLPRDWALTCGVRVAWVRYPRVRSKRQLCGHRTCIATLRGGVRNPRVLATSPRDQVSRCGVLRLRRNWALTCGVRVARVRSPHTRSRRHSCGHRTCIATLRAGVRIPQVLAPSPRGQVSRCGALRLPRNWTLTCGVQVALVRYPHARSKRQWCGHRICIANLRTAMWIPHRPVPSPHDHVWNCGAERTP